MRERWFKMASVRSFLSIALGSTAEVQTLAEIGMDLGFMEQRGREEIEALCVEMTKMILAMLRKMGD